MGSKNIFILGATGSIGTNSLKCIKYLNQSNSGQSTGQSNSDRSNSDSSLGLHAVSQANTQKIPSFNIVGISFHGNIDEAEKIIKEFSIKNVIITNKKKFKDFSKRLLAIDTTIDIFNDFAEALETVSYDILLNALMGSIGLMPTKIGITKGALILLANKETLVTAGNLINELLKKHRTKIIPIDSEHAAIFQMLHQLKLQPSSLKKIILTASGGPFFNNPIENPSIEETLKHPNWKMGKKISVDSATMMNKGLEVIEAHYLFDLSYARIETIIHPQSIVHSFLVTKDNSHYAQLGDPDMKHPIFNALTYPDVLKNNLKEYDLTKNDLTFHEVNLKQFPLLALAYACGEKGGSHLTVFNSANEAAVELFLTGHIDFKTIPKIVSKTVDQHNQIKNLTIEKILDLDKEIKEKIMSDYHQKLGK